MCFWSFRQTCSIDRWKWLPLMPILFSSPNELQSSIPKVIDDLQRYGHNTIVCGIHNTHLTTSWSYCCLFSLFSVSFVLDSTLLYAISIPKEFFRKNNSLMCTTTCLYACDITAMVLWNAVRFAGSLNTCSSGFYRSFNVVVVWNNARSHRQFHTHIENSLRQQ